jgi:hypothetical protein
LNREVKMTKQTGTPEGAAKRAVVGRCLIVGLILITVLASACGAQETLPPLLPPEEETPTETPVSPAATTAPPIAETPQATAAPPTTGTPQATAVAPVEEPTPEPAATPPATEGPFADWARYANAAYGFGLRFPPTWSIELLSDRTIGTAGDQAADAIRLTEPQEDGDLTIEILIEYRKPDQTVAIGPEALPEGEIEDRGTVRLLDRILPVHVLVHEGKDKAAFAGERFVDLELFIQVQQVGEEVAYEEVEIPASAYEILSQVLASVSRSDGVEAADLYPQWESYSAGDGAEGFSFRHPAVWSVQETSASPAASTVVLMKETYQLTIQYRSAGTSDALGPETMPEGLVMEAGATTFMGRLIPRNVVIHEDKLKMVFLSLDGETVDLYVALTADADQVPYPEIDLPEAIRYEMDQILASFQPHQQQ